MNLKESYRYSNYLSRLLIEAYSYMGNTEFVTNITQKHLRSQIDKDKMDEEIAVPKSCNVGFTPNDVIDFTVRITAERERLANAITIAKSTTEIDIDTAIAINKEKQEFIYNLKKLANVKSSEISTQGYGYKFNAEGNQMKYFYPVKEIITIDFNRDDVKRLIKKYSKECDDVSSKLDAIQINTEVDFTPLFDVNDAFEDALMSSKGNM